MLIDWFTLIAQILNFLLLLWLLKRFLFKPILKAIDEREKKIKKQIEGAEAKMKEADEEKNKFARRNREMDEKRESLLTEAVEKAHEKRKELLAEARQEMEELRLQLEQSIKEKQESLSREITNQTQKEVIAIARKVLTDLASSSLEEQLSRVFVNRLQQVEGAEKDQLVKALDGSAGKVMVKSAFELSPNQQAEIEEAITAITAATLKCHFEISSDQINGIELNIHGYKIAWSVADYLRSLEKKLAELLDMEPDFQSIIKPSPNELTA